MLSYQHALFEAEIMAMKLRMLIIFNYGVSTLYKKRFDIASDLRKLTDFFFLTLLLLAGVNPVYEHGGGYRKKS